MVSKTIEIRNNKALKVLQSLESINFIKISNMDDRNSKKQHLLNLKPKNQSESDSFFNLENNFSFLSVESLKLYFSIGYFSLM